DQREAPAEAVRSEPERDVEHDPRQGEERLELEDRGQVEAAVALVEHHEHRPEEVDGPERLVGEVRADDAAERGPLARSERAPGHQFNEGIAPLAPFGKAERGPKLSREGTAPLAPFGKAERGPTPRGLASLAC